MYIRVLVVPLQKMPQITRTVLTTSLLYVRHFNSTTKPSSRPAIKKQLTMDSLPDYRLPHDIVEYESGKNPSISLQDKLTKWENNKSLMRANESNYIESLRLMICLDEAADQVQLEKCNQRNVKLHHVDDNEFYFFVKPEMKDLYALIKQFDEFVLFSKDGTRVTDGQIIFKENNKIYVDLTNWHQDGLFDIVFRSNRTFYLLQHYALDLIRNYKLFDLLINNPDYYAKWDSDTNDNCTVESSQLIHLDLNEEQRQAVGNIVQGRYYPLPYLLYGPPGTGKTKTLVASILNIVATRS